MTRTSAAFTVSLLFALLAPSASASQDPETWEFSVFGGRTSFDSADPAALSLSGRVDYDDDGTAGGVRIFSRSLELEDDTFPGMRLGYNWNHYVESELVYDKNRTHAVYHHRLDEDQDEDGDIDATESVRGGVSLTVASYQLGLLVHPLGRKPIRWQPYAVVSAGYIAANLDPASGTATRIRNSDATRVLNLELSHDDESWLMGYGAGLKYYFTESLAVRAEARGKSSDLFDTRRDDFEVSLGVSFFAPGGDY